MQEDSKSHPRGVARGRLKKPRKEHNDSVYTTAYMSRIMRNNCNLAKALTEKNEHISSLKNMYDGNIAVLNQDIISMYQNMMHLKMILSKVNEHATFGITHLIDVVSTMTDIKSEIMKCEENQSVESLALVKERASAGISHLDKMRLSMEGIKMQYFQSLQITKMINDVPKPARCVVTGIEKNMKERAGPSDEKVVKIESSNMNHSEINPRWALAKLASCNQGMMKIIRESPGPSDDKDVKTKRGTSQEAIASTTPRQTLAMLASCNQEVNQAIQEISGSFDDKHVTTKRGTSQEPISSTTPRQTLATLASCNQEMMKTIKESPGPSDHKDVKTKRGTSQEAIASTTTPRRILATLASCNQDVEMTSTEESTRTLDRNDLKTKRIVFKPHYVAGNTNKDEKENVVSGHSHKRNASKTISYKEPSLVTKLRRT